MTKDRFVNMDCPVEVGKDCVMPNNMWRKHDTALALFIAGIIISLLVWAGGPNGVNAHFSSLDAIIVQHEKKDNELHDAQEKLDRKTEDRLKSIDEKLDRLIERRP